MPRRVLVPTSPRPYRQEPTEGIIDTLGGSDLSQYAAPLRGTWRALREIDAAARGREADAYRTIGPARRSVPDQGRGEPAVQVTLSSRPRRGARRLSPRLREGVALLPRYAGPRRRDWEQFGPIRRALRDARGASVRWLERGGRHRASVTAVRRRVAPLSPTSRFRPGSRCTGPLRPARCPPIFWSPRAPTGPGDRADRRRRRELAEPAAAAPDLVTVACLIARSSGAVAAGDYQWHQRSPHGATCSAGFATVLMSQELTDESCGRAGVPSDAVFAEIVHLPEGGSGNLLAPGCAATRSLTRHQRVDPDKQIPRRPSWSPWS